MRAYAHARARARARACCRTSAERDVATPQHRVSLLDETHGFCVQLQSCEATGFAEGSRVGPHQAVYFSRVFAISADQSMELVLQME